MNGAPVELDSGTIRGLPADRHGVAAWLGIPFAAAPVGALRWRAPKPVSPWSGVRDCQRYGAACPQPAQPGDALMREFGFAEPPECAQDEDCLFLNVWAPSAARPGELPVLVFLHGGGHRLGSGSHPVSRGGHLAAEGVVVVTVNYRLGALGYLAHPALNAESGTSGNYACLDVIAALQWVQRNIHAFGGRPDRVALCGQSAGAALVHVLMASPLARGLFQRAVVHSGGRWAGTPPGAARQPDLHEASEAGARMATARGATTLAALRALPPDALDAPRGFWGPIVDGLVQAEAIEQVFDRGAQAPVPLLVGYTRDETTPFPLPGICGLESWRAFVQHRFGADAGRVHGLYPARDDAQAQSASHALRRDAGFAWQAWRLARRHGETSGQPVYLFNFTRDVPLRATAGFHEPMPPGGFGAYHGSELWYLFGNMEQARERWTDDDRHLSARMRRLWAAFAANGVPAAEGLPDWPEFMRTGQAMRLDRQVQPGPVFNQAGLHFFDACADASGEAAAAAVAC